MRRLLFPFVVLLIFLFSFSIIAQQYGRARSGIEISIPVKLHKAVLDPLPAGTYTIGAGGYFATITDAFNKLSIDGIGGEVTLELIDTLYIAPTDSFGFKLVGPIPGAGPNSRVILKPAANKNVVLQGNGRYVIYFFNTSYLNIDGVSTDGETTLTIYSIFNSLFDLNRATRFSANSDHNIIQNLTCIGEDLYRYGDLIVFGAADNSSAPDSNLIQNNFIKKGGGSIVIGGFSSSRRAIGNIVRNNKIGSQTDSLISWGIQLENCQNTIVENNIVQNMKVTTNVGDIFIPGINSLWGSGDIIRKNTVYNINPSKGYSSVGILLSGLSGEFGNNNQVYNNMVYDINSTSTQYDSRVTGIQMWYQNNPKIYYNSVYLSGTGANKYGSAALYISLACYNVDVKNNIFVNTRDESPYCASAIYSVGSGILTDYNNLYYEPNQNNCLVKIGSNDYHTLAEWTVTGKDLFSVSEMLNFTGSDLHMDSGYLTNTESRGTPIAGIDTDFDGDARDSQHPDIGADEFEGQTRIFSQESWTKHDSPVLLPGSAGEWDDDGFISPFVIIDETTYKMWYGASDGTTFRIGYATSPDGINWTKYDDPSTTNHPYAESDPVLNIGPGAWDNSWVYAPMLYFNGTTYHMWYGGTDGDHDRVGYATSPDGITWTKNPANPVINLGSSGSWDDTSVDPGPIIIDGTTFQMLYNGFDGLHFQGGYAASNDGINWTKSADPILVYGPTGNWDNPRVQLNSLVYDDSTSKYFLFYSGGVLFDWRIGYATAPALNGPWAKDPSIVLDVTPGGFESDVVGFPYVIEDPVSNLYKMWYLGGSSGSVGAIGYATTPNWPLAVEGEKFDEVPTEFVLSQNYPNPFNPCTKFRYSITNASNVMIKIYNVLGKEIETLVNEEKSTGTYELNWNAANLPSGVYFYRLQAGDFVQTKKMILLK